MADVLFLGTASQQPADAAPPPAPQSAPEPPPGLFHELLSDLNPLQYIPVVGTIYRAITGDQGNPTLRFVASFGTSFAIGGPIGVAITAGEDLAGIDPALMVLNAARHLFHLGHAESVPAPVPATTPAPSAPSNPQLAFAVSSGNMSADDLNELELQRLNA